MSNIDMSQIITAEDKAADAALERAGAIKAQVQATIYAVADQNTQSSLLAAAVAGSMSNADKMTFASGQAWIEAVKAEGRRAIADGDNPIWPDIPAGVADLAARY